MVDKWDAAISAAWPRNFVIAHWIHVLWLDLLQQICSAASIILQKLAKSRCRCDRQRGDRRSENTCMVIGHSYKDCRAMRCCTGWQLSALTVAWLQFMCNTFQHKTQNILICTCICIYVHRAFGDLCWSAYRSSCGCDNRALCYAAWNFM